MITVSEIKELQKYLIGTQHANRIQQQEEDDSFYKDTFKVPWIQDLTYIVRTGKAARMIDTPAEHIITSNPQVFREPVGKGIQQNERVSAELNRWATLLLRQQPQPYKEFVKNLLLRGEAWIYTLHNENFNPDDPQDIPIRVILPDPLIVFMDSTQGEKYGRPQRVIISFDRVAWDVKQNYPEWAWDQKGNKQWSETVPFLMYWDNDVRYFEADKEALFRDANGDLSNGDGIQENIYGFVPFVHSYSGFGRGSPDGDPASLAMGRLRWVRDLLREQCAIRSTLNTLMLRYAHKTRDLSYPAGGPEPTGDIGENYDNTLNAFNIIGLPPGATLTVAESQLPEPQVFQHLYNIEQQILNEDPLGLVAQAIGSSGRQQDIVSAAALRRYDTVVENTAHTFAVALGMVGLQMVEKIPGLMPKGIHKGDINGNYICRIELKATDPIEQDRLRTLGSRLYQMGEIDLLINLTKYQGYTEEEAKKIMARILADNATRNNPLIAQVMGMQAAKEIGMEQEYEILKSQGSKEQPLSPVPQIGSEGGEPRVGNIKTPLGQEMLDMSLVEGGARRGPQ